MATGSWNEADFIPYEAALRCPAGPALVLAPHADDEALGCGGAIMRHLEAGDGVSVIIATDSDYGHFQAGEDGRVVRRREAEAAAAVLGYGSPGFWGLADRGLVYGERLVGRVLDALEQTGAAVLYAPSWWEIHPDHQVLALAALEATRRSQRPLTLAMYEVGVPLHPNRLLDITDLAARKQAAIACYASQLQVQRYDRHVSALNLFRTYTLPASVESAEAFRLLDARELRRDFSGALDPEVYYARDPRRADRLPRERLDSVPSFAVGKLARLEAQNQALLQRLSQLEAMADGSPSQSEHSRTGLPITERGPGAQESHPSGDESTATDLRVPGAGGGSPASARDMPSGPSQPARLRRFGLRMVQRVKLLFKGEP